MAADEGSDVPVRGVVCACEAKADIEVDGVCASSGSDAELRVIYRGAEVKAR